MKAVVLDGVGGPEVLRLGEVEPPRLKSGQVLIEVRATSVNRPDTMQRQGKYPPPPGESEILGLEAAGTIAEIAPDVHGFAKGQRVAALLPGGGYAELAAAYAGHVLPIADSMSFEEAACICETYITAYMNLFMYAALEDGETVLVHGGSGGVGTAAIQLVEALAPASRVATTASAGKAARVAALGADRVIDYRSEDFAAVALELTEQRGVDVILDHIGGAYFERNMQALAVGGRLALIAVMGGTKAEIHLGRLLVNRQRIMGSVLRPRPVEEKAKIIACFARDVMPLFAARRIVPVIDRVYPIEEVAAAHAAMDSGAHFGKLVLKL